MKVLSRKMMAGLLCGAALSFGVQEQARASGLLIADGGLGGVLEMIDHDVHVTLNNGIAVTRVTQVFHNTESRQVEALYTFPVPKGASVANFSMWINGKEMVGEVVEKERAREIYNSYKAKRQDPGLLEQVDYKTFEMRIFPIGPEADQKVQIAYYQELDQDHDWANYVYPLNTTTRPGIDSRIHGRFSFNLEAKSAIPVKAIESPSHAADLVMATHSENCVQASMELTGSDLKRDVVVAMQHKRPRTGFDLITSNVKGDDGYFQLQLTVGEDLEALDMGMDYLFVLDISGSMANDGKLPVSREAISAFVDQLGPEDRFELMAFNVQPSVLFEKLSPVAEASLAKATDFLNGQQARGGTTLTPAVRLAYNYADPDRPLNVVILSDGMSEQRERAELVRLIRDRPRNVRVFCIGVGNDINRPLLEQVARDSGGLASFISRGDNFSRQAKAFRRKLTRPVASELELQIDGVAVRDIEPRTLPNLYHGSPLRIYGRYAKAGPGQVSIKGNIRGKVFEKSVRLDFPKRDEDNPEIERMWAWQRMDRLLKLSPDGKARDQALDEIVRLGEAYSITSEYTSFLVLENDAEYRRWQIDQRNGRRILRDRAAQERLRKEFAQLRERAVADLGPAPVQVAKRQAPSLPKPAMNRTQNTQPAKTRSRDLDFGFGGGTGPVGPFFIGIMLWLRRVRGRREINPN